MSTTSSDTPGQPDLLLFVCDGNLARSPAAELISRHRSAVDGPWRFASCGIRAVRSDRVLREVERRLAVMEVPAGGFHSRQATPAILGEARLILTAGRLQNDWIVDETPFLYRRTYTIRQAARLLRDLPQGGEPLEHLARTKDRLTDDDEVEDPIRKGVAAAGEVVDQIDEALRVILPALGAMTRRAG
ncbi:low molecular weight phosphatase family protein [Allobranchiibius sp. CTAmp26]|uniref:arsenate-mycothiol transferase ArsC n=1 Tax=Allobranchiibius sp. CTAmp26 TaxID=2815214 RepID=UPI001AA0EC75|nr:hypothetical protein [Allobranchiibius sp. CTAmp26]MBO1755221.1 hypothetical protein [Allobranchiibius sp. CTAmp26]